MTEKDPNKIIVLQMCFPMYFTAVDFSLSNKTLNTTKNYLFNFLHKGFSVEGTLMLNKLNRLSNLNIVVYTKVM